jgi:integrase
MGAYKDRGSWRYQKKNVMHWDGVRRTVRGTPDINTKAAALDAERAHLERVRVAPRLLVPTFEEWFRGKPTEDGEFTGRFWIEWVVGRMNKPSERRSKRTVYAKHLHAAFGHLPLDRIGVAEIARFRAHLVELGLSKKRINLILCVLSKPLKYAADCDIIPKAPKIGLLKADRPQIVAWTYEEYARLLAAAKIEGDDWHTAVSLAGEAGLRVGEIKALRWREDVDMVARTITVNQQTCEGVTGTPKGGKRRTIPMTPALHESLRSLSTIREGYVLRGTNGPSKSDGETDSMIARICRRAGLPVRYWHTLRHTFGTHAALLGVNCWRLQTWLGHARIDETMRYVHVAEHHARETPEVVRGAADGLMEPDARVLAMLGARAKVPTNSLTVNMPAKRRSPRLGSPGAHEHSADSSGAEQAGETNTVSLAALGSEGGFRIR